MSAPVPEPAPSGSHSTTPKLHALLYGELRTLAGLLMQKQPPGQSLQASDLVSEAYMRLLRAGEIEWKSREHYVRAAACAMRSVLVDHARMRNRKYVSDPGGGTDEEPSALDLVVIEHEDRAIDLIALDRALEALAVFDPTMARAVELRFFAGLEIDEAARVLGVSERTLRRHWAAARAWLHRHMEGGA